MRRAREAARLEALRATGLLDTPAEPTFDDLARLAALVCGAPIALVSLVDEHRQWSKAKVGLDASETPRDVAFCAHAIADAGADDGRLFEIRDALRDARFAGNPLVAAAPHVRFYAGACLMTYDRHALGTLAVLDHVPRELSPDQRSALQALARQVVAQIDLRRKATELARANAALVASAESALAAKAQLDDILDNASELVQSIAPTGAFLYVNKTWRETLGYSDRDLERITLFDVIAPDCLERCMAAFERVIAGEAIRGFEAVFVTKTGQRVVLEGSATCRFANGQPIATRGIFRDITEPREIDQLKNELASTVSYEIDAPLTAMYDALGLVEGRLPRSLPVTDSPPAPLSRGSAPDGELRAALAELRAEYSLELPGMMEALVENIQRARGDPGNPILVREARSRAHRMYGTAGSHGFASISAAAGRIEVALEALEVGASAPAEVWITIDDALAVLTTALAPGALGGAQAGG